MSRGGSQREGGGGSWGVHLSVCRGETSCQVLNFVNLSHSAGQIVEPGSCCSSFIDEGSDILLLYATVAHFNDAVQMNASQAAGNGEGEFHSFI